MISSDPPGIAYARTSRYRRSTCRSERIFQHGLTCDASNTHLLALAAAHVGGAAEDLRRLACAELEHLGGLRLQQRSRTTKLRFNQRAVSTQNGDAVRVVPHLLHGVLLGQRAHLVRDVLQLRMRALHLARHLANFGSDDGVLHQRLAERLALQRILERLLQAHAREAAGLNGQSPALVVEVVPVKGASQARAPDDYGVCIVILT